MPVLFSLSGNRIRRHVISIPSSAT